MQKVMIIGRLGQDPELKYTPGGNAVCNFSMATSKKWTDKSGEKKEKTSWHRLVAWGKSAETINQYVKKGSMLFVEGELEYGSYEKDGVKHYTTDINVNRFEFLGGSKTESKPSSTTENYPESSHQEQEFANEDIPF